MRPVGLIFLLLLVGCSNKPLPHFEEVPDFTLTSETGSIFDRASLNGQVWVADFIFTNCEGPCPRMTSLMYRMQKLTAKVKFVSFSVDPARDTPAAFAAYAKKFKADPARWSFLTGDTAELNRLAHDVFKLSSVGNGMDHSTRFVLVDKNGRIRGYYGISDGDPVSRIAHDAERLQKEPA